MGAEMVFMFETAILLREKHNLTTRLVSSMVLRVVFEALAMKESKD